MFVMSTAQPERRATAFADHFVGSVNHDRILQRSPSAYWRTSGRRTWESSSYRGRPGGMIEDHQVGHLTQLSQYDSSQHEALTDHRPGNNGVARKVLIRAESCAFYGLHDWPTHAKPFGSHDANNGYELFAHCFAASIEAS